jgi:magnesium transporter
MLRAMSGKAPPLELSPDRAALAAEVQALWLDLDRPSEAERHQAARATGLRVPDLHEVAEIESSSRLVNDHGVLYLSTPMVSRGVDTALVVAPLGFVIARDRLITIRFAPSLVFDHFAAEWRSEETGAPTSGMQPFLGLIEAIVDRLADHLEQMGADLDALSAEVFRRGAHGVGSARKRDDFLQTTLADIGQKGARISQVRDGLLGVGRIARFVPETAGAWLHADEAHRLATLDRDIVSLTDYDAQLTGKVHFLLDATLGFINIEQNDTIKILTVVSIVGIPPTFIASLYGMNFHNMPELGWTYGYAYGLSLIALSIVVPLLLFWRRGWL